MKRVEYILSQLSCNFLCEENFLQSFLLKLHALENQAEESAWLEQNAEKNANFFAIPQQDGTMMFAGVDSEEQIPPGSVYIMRLSGPVMPETSWNIPGLDLLTAQISWATDHENIAAIVFQLETGGGSSYGLWQFCDLLRESAEKKPIVMHLNGVCASAGVAMHVCGTESFSVHSSTRIGSIGVAVNYLDILGIFEKWGAKFHYVNAKTNPDKNASFMDMRKGNYERLEAELTEMHAEFKALVKANRADVPDEAMTGKMYNTTQAMAHGLVDGVATLEQAVSRAVELSQTHKPQII